jgi:26S proteasome regulatory subunit N10
MRNGDYIPTRLGAQHDAANLLVTQKTRSNPESTVGVLAMSGGKYMHGGGTAGGNDGRVKQDMNAVSSNMELLVSPTDDMGKILNALHGIPIRGGAGLDPHSSPSGVDISASIQVASLALKHRRNKNGQQRIVLFVGSPLTHVDSRSLVKTGKTLKKNNVAIDVIAMGELEENETKLRELVDAANGGEAAAAAAATGERTCHLVTIPPGVLPSDVLLSSPILHGGAADTMASGAGEAGAGGGFADFGGVDPNMDPELAMALRISMEEERARQERLTREQQGSNPVPDAAAVTASSSSAAADVPVPMDTSGSTAPAVSSSSFHASASLYDDDMGDEDALLQQALAMSMAESNVLSSTLEPMETESKAPVTTVTALYGEAGDDEDAEMRMALEMSMQDSQTVPGSANQTIHDPHFVHQLLESIPGASPAAALANLPSASNDNETNDMDEEKEENENKKEK